jgi:hypothetical protein
LNFAFVVRLARHFSPHAALSVLGVARKNPKNFSHDSFDDSMLPQPSGTSGVWMMSTELRKISSKTKKTYERKISQNLHLTRFTTISISRAFVLSGWNCFCWRCEPLNLPTKVIGSNAQQLRECLGRLHFFFVFLFPSFLPQHESPKKKAAERAKHKQTIGH